MNAEQAGNYLAAILSTAVVGVLIPLLILVAMGLGLKAMVLHSVDHPDAFIAKMLLDDAGNPSSERLVTLVAVVITSWMCSVIVFSQPQLILEAMGMQMVGWGGRDLTKHWLSSRPALAAAQSDKGTP